MLLVIYVCLLNVLAINDQEYLVCFLLNSIIKRDLSSRSVASRRGLIRMLSRNYRMYHSKKSTCLSLCSISGVSRLFIICHLTLKPTRKYKQVSTENA